MASKSVPTTSVANSNPFENLPDGVLILLFGNTTLYFRDLLRVVLVCKRFHAIITQQCRERFKPDYFFWRTIEKMRRLESSNLVTTQEKNSVTQQLTQSIQLHMQNSQLFKMHQEATTKSHSPRSSWRKSVSDPHNQVSPSTSPSSQGATVKRSLSDEGVSTTSNNNHNESPSGKTKKPSMFSKLVGKKEKKKKLSVSDESLIKQPAHIPIYRTGSENGFKVLTAGTGQQGRTTFCKQTRLLFGKPFETSEIVDFRKFIRKSPLTVISHLLESSIEKSTVENQKKYKDWNSVLNQIDFENESSSHDTASLRKTLKLMSEDPTFRRVLYSEASSGTLHKTVNMEHVKYFMENHERMLAKDYTPSLVDILMCRIRTIGVEETPLKIEHHECVIVDSGGERSERKKWVNCFDDNNILLYFVSLTDYDMVLSEDPSTPRLQESLMLYEELADSKWFQNTFIMVIFTREDMFADKIHRVPIQDYYPDYTGGRKYTQSLEFIVRKFRSLCPAHHTFRYHILSTIDTESILNCWRKILDLYQDYLKKNDNQLTIKNHNLNVH